jgi:hypothetical protein
LNPLDDVQAVIGPGRTPKQEPPDFRNEFWRQVPDMRSTVDRETPATLNRCVFDTANKRVYHGANCPHLPVKDEHA